jgi:hypothetical protein
MFEYSLINKYADGSYACSAYVYCPSAKSPASGYISTCPTPPGAPLTAGFAVGTEYSGVPCSAATTATGSSIISKLGYCTAGYKLGYAAVTSQLVNAYGPSSGAPSGYVMRTFYTDSAACAGSTSYSIYYLTGKCPSAWTSSDGYFSVYSVAAAVPTPPTRDIAVYNYASAAACAATDASQIIGATFYDFGLSNYTQTSKCYNTNSTVKGTYNRNYCGPQSFVSSNAQSGGFVVVRQYAVSPCCFLPSSSCSISFSRPDFLTGRTQRVRWRPREASSPSWACVNRWQATLRRGSPR